MSDQLDALWVGVVAVVAVIAILFLNTTPALPSHATPVTQESSSGNLGGMAPGSLQVVSCSETDGADPYRNGFITFMFSDGRKLTLDESKYILNGNDRVAPLRASCMDRIHGLSDTLIKTGGIQNNAVVGLSRAFEWELTCSGADDSSALNDYILSVADTVCGPGCLTATPGPCYQQNLCRGQVAESINYFSAGRSFDAYYPPQVIKAQSVPPYWTTSIGPGDNRLLVIAARAAELQAQGFDGSQSSPHGKLLKNYVKLLVGAKDNWCNPDVSHIGPGSSAPIASCGSADQACCTSNPACSSGLSCKNNKCVSQTANPAIGSCPGTCRFKASACDQNGETNAGKTGCGGKYCCVPKGIKLSDIKTNLDRAKQKVRDVYREVFAKEACPSLVDREASIMMNRGGPDNVDAVNILRDAFRNNPGNYAHTSVGDGC